MFTAVTIMVTKATELGCVLCIGPTANAMTPHLDCVWDNGMGPLTKASIEELLGIKYYTKTWASLDKLSIKKQIHMRLGLLMKAYLKRFGCFQT